MNKFNSNQFMQTFAMYPTGIPTISPSSLFPVPNIFTDDIYKEFEKKKKRIRTNFTPYQLDILETAFNKTHFPDLEKKKKLAKQTELPDLCIQVWFKNRRAKHRKQSKIIKSMSTSSEENTEVAQSNTSSVDNAKEDDHENTMPEDADEAEETREQRELSKTPPSTKPYDEKSKECVKATSKSNNFSIHGLTKASSAKSVEKSRAFHSSVPPIFNHALFSQAAFYQNLAKISPPNMFMFQPQIPDSYSYIGYLNYLSKSLNVLNDVQ